MKRGEKSRFIVSQEFLAENEDEGMEAFFEGTPWDKNNFFVMDMELLSLIKVEDWYQDKSAVMRTLRKGKGRNAYTDSTVYFRIKIDVNGNEIFSNYPESELPIEKQDDFKDKTIEERVDILKDDKMIKCRLNQYILPSILQKLIKSMKKNMVVTMTTNKIKDKLHSNFVSDWLN